MVEYFKMLAPWIRNCHIHELNSKYPYKEFFGLLKQRGYDRLTLLEQGRVPRSKADLVKYLKQYAKDWSTLVQRA